MAEKPKKPRKPKPEGDAKPKRAGSSGGGWFRWLLWTAAIVLVYALSAFPAHWLIRHWQGRPSGTDAALMAVYTPLRLLCDAVPPVGRFYNQGFSLLD